MKVLPTALATHLAQGTTTLAYLLKIVRKDSLVYSFTSADTDVTISNIFYTASQGLSISSIQLSSGLNVDNLELSTLDDGSVFNKYDVLGGRWDNAAFTISRYNWASPTDGVDIILVGTIGNITINDNIVTAELRGLQQYLQQPIGSIVSKTCRARLGDSNCTVSLAPYTYTGTVTVGNNLQQFTDTAAIQASDYFGEGIVTFTSGVNIGLSQKVKTFASGVFTLSLPMIQVISIGDTFTAIAGCRKRLLEDCYTKFNNDLNFQGEPHLPGTDALA